MSSASDLGRDDDLPDRFAGRGFAIQRDLSMLVVISSIQGMGVPT